jgi:Tfp pilus assembly protein FimT
MNQLTHSTNAFGAAVPDATPLAAADALQARFALRVAARLTERAQEVSPDVTERLRFAREKALERARASRTAQAAAPVGANRAGVAILGAGSGWWLKLASALPALALVAGLVLIQRWQDNAQVSVAAEVDAALLSDDLPPNAYSDAGFAEFLKTPIE